MRFIADLHIHSHFSMATSRNLNPELMDLWARRKGINVIGTGDFTHPGWLNELQQKLIPEETGLFRIRSDYRQTDSINIPDAPDPRFVLSSEISCIYKKGNQVRKVHLIFLMPDLKSVEDFRFKLNRTGANLNSDGRPILGMDSRDLLEMALDCSPETICIPAHIWTPWFSVMGARSGFDSIEGCFDDLADHVAAVETGLSSSPAMNRMCPALDEYLLISSSDAHSPEKLGRNATIFDHEMTYDGIRQSLTEEVSASTVQTIDLYPQEGKYYFDGHRKCAVRMNPKQTRISGEKCPVCIKPVTVGVLNRVMQLSPVNRHDTPDPNTGRYIIPLKEILGEILNMGTGTKRVNRVYQSVLSLLGPELDILVNIPISELESATDDVLAESIRRMRAGKINVEEGFDGQFGTVRVFKHAERSRQKLHPDIWH